MGAVAPLLGPPGAILAWIAELAKGRETRGVIGTGIEIGTMTVSERRIGIERRIAIVTGVVLRLTTAAKHGPTGTRNTENVIAKAPASEAMMMTMAVAQSGIKAVVMR
jgi:hypothetical protein